MEGIGERRIAQDAHGQSSTVRTVRLPTRYMVFVVDSPLHCIGARIRQRRNPIFFALFACFLCRQCGLDGHDYMHLLCWVSLSEGHTQQQRITDKNVVGAVREANSIFDASGHYIITITTERLRVIWK